ncbi:MAG: DEAD/DEAH box helicase [Gemmataceae bacterium]
MITDPLDLFLPPVREWFRHHVGSPTHPQRLGWPSIAAGRHTLILAPTGSGKTLAAFLACLDHLWRQPDLPRGVRVLYVSPLKALNNDIHRNLQRPLDGVAAAALALGHPLPTLEAAVRTGDTTTAERQRQSRRPPHVLITTPESLNLLLTSQARETLRGVTHVIIDEIHALCPNKRGVFLALLLERLEALQRGGTFVRVGLSATQRPLDEVARYLGGRTFDGSAYTPRPVNVVDGGLRKDLDLGVVSPVEAFGPLPEKTVWPSIYRLLASLIREHTSTLVFANDRRSVERITAFLNEDEAAPAGTSPAREVALSGAELARAHHGSVDLERRHEIEADLKAGRLPAVVATASLEMGIDMGAIDLVCQVASPGNVARALQRVGRAGHVVGQKSKGRFIPRTAADLVEQAVLVREMTAGRVEFIRVPVNCLDLLAQQLVAMASIDEWKVPDLYALVRRAYPFRDLTSQAFEATLEMITGRYRFQPEDGGRPAATMEALQPRVSWDRVNNRLVALPGSKQMALLNGGTIPDTGQYAAYTTKGVRIGELDEEFIYERRVGDTFLLGTSSWRVEKIDADRVIVAPAEGGAPALVPFWRGEGGGRSYDLGQAIGAFLRELVGRIDEPDTLQWLRETFGLCAASSRSLKHHVTKQLVAAGTVPTDLTLLIEASRDQLGDWQILLLSPFGARVHLALRFAIENALTARLGYRPQCLHHDDGLIVRLTDADEPVLDLLTGITDETLEGRILEELADSALFALRFRQNAARALLLPKGPAGKRSPLWLQRLRGRDLLQVARRHPDFPVVVETFRECLHDHLDVPRLRQLLADIRGGTIEVVTRKADVPSPFASGLMFAFTAANLYSPDDSEKASSGTNVDRDLLDQILTPESREHLLDPRAVTQVDRRLRGVGLPPRTPAEMAEWLRRLGDVADDELEGPMEALLGELLKDGRAVRITLPKVERPERWIAAEDRQRYESAFLSDTSSADAAKEVFSLFLQTHALVGLDDVLRRYPFDRPWAQRQLEEWLRAGRAVRVEGQERFATPANLEQVQRGSLGLLRREVVACQPPAFADFVLRWQRLHAAGRRGGPEGLAEVLGRLQGVALPIDLWEESVLPARVPGYQPRWLDDWVAGGSGVWVMRGDGVAFYHRSMLSQLSPADGPALEEPGRVVAEALNRSGAAFLSDLAIDTGLAPSAVRSRLWELARRGLVSCDRVDVARRGEPDEEPLAAKKPTLRAMRRQMTQRPEGRWQLLKWGRPTPEELAVAQCSLLLERYGVAARELAATDDGLLPWRVLYEVLSRLELTGEVRRGYFVEGLSGAQFALPEAMDLLLDAPSTAAAPVTLVHSMDPANLYGAGAPFDVALLDGGTRPLLRRPGNWVALKAGRPVLLVESQGKKVTALASASRDDVTAAVKTLPGIFERQKDLTVRHKLTVEEWNGGPVTAGPGRELLEAAGFVRDYNGMTLYAAWR